MSLEKFRPRGADHHQRPGRPGGHRLDHPDQPFVRPVQILEHDYRRLAGRKRGQETWPGTRHLLAHSLRLDLVERVVRHRQVGAGSQREEGGLAFAGADSDRLERLARRFV